jgi:hypothetical protein
VPTKRFLSGFWAVLKWQKQQRDAEQREDQKWQKIVKDIRSDKKRAGELIDEIAQLGERAVDRALTDVAESLPRHDDGASGAKVKLLQLVERRGKPLSKRQESALQALIRDEREAGFPILRQIEEKCATAKTEPRAEYQSRSTREQKLVAEARTTIISWLSQPEKYAPGLIEAIGTLGGEQVDAALPSLISFFREHPNVPEKDMALSKLMEVVKDKGTRPTEEQLAELRTLLSEETKHGLSNWELLRAIKDDDNAGERESEDLKWERIIAAMRRSPETAAKRIEDIARMGDAHLDRAFGSLIGFLREHADAQGGLLKLMQAEESKQTPLTQKQVDELKMLTTAGSGEEHEAMKRLEAKLAETKAEK